MIWKNELEFFKNYSFFIAGVCLDTRTGQLKEFRFFYNYIRPHQHLDYRTPNEVWNNEPMANSKTHEAIYFNALCGNVAGFYFME